MAVLRADDARGGRRGGTPLPGLDHEGLPVCDEVRQGESQRGSTTMVCEREESSRRTERLGVLPALEPLELLREVGLHLGHLDKRVGRLEALQLADDARHFLHGRRRRQRDGAGGARRKERARHVVAVKVDEKERRVGRRRALCTIALEDEDQIREEELQCDEEHRQRLSREQA